MPSTTTWTATVSGGAAWLSVTPTSGTGSAQIEYAATANTAASARTGSIAILGQTLTVTQAAGGGVASQLALSAASLAFGADALGLATGTQRVLVSNTGSASLTLGSVALSGAAAGDFIASGNCSAGLVLAAGASCYVDVRFDPTVLGARSASLQIGISGGATSTVTLGGTGVPDSSSDGPLPSWAYALLGLLMWRITLRHRGSRVIG